MPHGMRSRLDGVWTRARNLPHRQQKRPLVAGGPESFALESALGVLAGEVEAEGEYPDAGKRCENPSRHFSILQVSL